MKKRLFELNVTGWTSYVPYFFEKACYKKDFEKAVQEAIKSKLSSITKEGRYISGHSLLEAVAPALEEQGFRRVRPDYEIGLDGDCIYCGEGKRPKIIDKETWDRIVSYNTKMQKRLRKRVMKKYRKSLKD